MGGSHTPGVRGALDVGCEFLLSNTPKGTPLLHSSSQSINTDKVRLTDMDPRTNFVPLK